MKNAFSLLAFLFFVSVFFLHCDRQPKEPTKDATGTSSPDIVQIPNPLKFYIKGQKNGSGIGQIEVKKISASGIVTRISDFAGSLEMPNVAESDKLEFYDEHNRKHALTYYMQAINYLHSLNVYLKQQGANDDNTCYIFGKVLKKDSSAYVGVMVTTQAGTITRTYTTDSGGNYRLEVYDRDINKITIKFSKTKEVILGIENIKDTVQLDVYLDDITTKDDSTQVKNPLPENQ